MTTLYKAIKLLVILIAFILIADAGYISLKAHLAQWLLNRAWQENISVYQVMADSENQHSIQFKASEISPTMTLTKPWPWADIVPVAKLEIPRLALKQVVLDNDSGQALAFGPGMTRYDASDKITIISGHRDTHLKALAYLAVGDDIRLQKLDGIIQTYNVTTIMVLDTRNEELYLSNSIKNNDNNHGLILITCYPFDSVSASTPYRLVVQAS